eukprot:TRINITY_DN6467_c0_g1_i1.p1 TRINITY_DN6467_c0_g1~~TRINITY_DN6467_c0_g1_i1.p1  ORF type:complete len:497 (+),score=152.69 TRINITY_DN6467_c0_g1_i1:44-1534(+)
MKITRSFKKFPKKISSFNMMKRRDQSNASSFPSSSNITTGSEKKGFSFLKKKRNRYDVNEKSKNLTLDDFIKMDGKDKKRDRYAEDDIEYVDDEEDIEIDNSHQDVKIKKEKPNNIIKAQKKNNNDIVEEIDNNQQGAIEIKGGNLIGHSVEELKSKLEGIIDKPFRAKQIFHSIYKSGADDFKEMRNLPKHTIEKLQTNNFTLFKGSIKKLAVSNDGTKKYLINFAKTNEDIETVYIPEESRGSLCISSQIGCTLNCKFCYTGTQKILRNLTAAEIVSQVLTVKRDLNDYPKDENERRKITNILFMGQGEPLYNYLNVKKAIGLLIDSEAFNFGARKVTLSTSGVVPNIPKLAKDFGGRIRLAISLHSVDNDIRSQLMDINLKFPLSDLRKALLEYPVKDPQKITFEYVMLKDTNDKLSQAKDLVEWLKGLKAKVNLIPFNPWPNSPFEASSRNQIMRFQQEIQNSGIEAPIRLPRGQDILAACGTLKTQLIENK